MQSIVMKRSLIAQNSSIAVLAIFFIFYSCAASTGSRYQKDEKIKIDETSSIKNDEVKETSLKEDFDITPYKTKIVIPEKKISTSTKNQNVWFDYGSPTTDTKTKTLVGTDAGFRVLVLTSDNLEEANQIKADVYFSENSYEVYIDFEPPFYKVKVGDFTSQKLADELRFKLNQLGYKDAKVIKDTINIFK